jgi:hypothetical protein
MPRVLLAKELRETAGVVAIGLALYFYFVVKAMRHELLPWFASGYYSEMFEIPFVGHGYLANFAWVSAGLTIALGFRQSLGESIHGTWLFLLHRPVAWKRLLGVKLLVGVASYLICSAAAILVYAWWAATPGTHASPFAWSMTMPIWKLWITMPIVYLGAFLSGIRPGRWTRTRLLPLAAGGVMAAVIPSLPWWPLSGLGLIGLLCVVLVRSIFYVAETRDF